ncbi:MAG: DUF2330 domain-containing protein [Alphaproteobacteria bacterium]|nr:DUF2330 domain-containing protein [Alphaproteobacteria bacterium]
MTRKLWWSASILVCPSMAQAFCGTYLGPAGDAPSNGESVLVLSMVNGHTVLTMANDFEGDVEEFGLLVPVPAGFDAASVVVPDAGALETLDVYSGPRVVGYTCEQVWDGQVHRNESQYSAGGCSGTGTTRVETTTTTTGVTTTSLSDAELRDVIVKSRATVGAYELAVVAADDTEGLQEWLDVNGLAMSAEVEPVIQQFMDRGTWFLAATVSAGTDAAWLEPLQLIYDSELRAIPLKLGTTSSEGVQDLVLYTLATSRVRITNYEESVIEDECMPKGSSFYDDAVDDALLSDEPTDRATWAVEYGWGAGKCDPCTDNGPLDPDTLATLGWHEAFAPYVTRIRMRYTPDQIDEDVLLQLTGDGRTSQLRYVDYDAKLEDLFPVCGEGWVPEPGTCGEAPEAAAMPSPPASSGGSSSSGSFLCSSIPTTVSAGTVGLMSALIRRRKRRMTPRV